MKNKTLLIATEKRFYLNHHNEIVDLDNTRSYDFWSRYLDVFDKVFVIARINKRTLITKTAAIVEGKNIKVFSLTDYQGARKALFKSHIVKKEIISYVEKFRHPYILLRLPGNIGNLLANYCLNKKMRYAVEVVGDPYEVFSTQKNILLKAYAILQRNKLKKIVRNATSAAYVTEHYLQNIYPLPNGFKTNYSSIQLNRIFLNQEKTFSNPNLSIIGVGSLEFPYKGVSVLLKGLKLLTDSGIEYRMTWLGRGKLLESYKELAKQLKIDSYVSFPGAVPNEEIPKYLKKNNIFILPSLTEGLPRSMVEAMAGSLICLGSNVGGIPELLQKKCLFQSNDSTAIFNKLKEVFENFPEYKKFTSINFEKAKQYLPEILQTKRNQFYNSIKPI